MSAYTEPPVGDDRAGAAATIPVAAIREWAATAGPFGGDAPPDWEGGYNECLADLSVLLDEHERAPVEAALLAAAAEANARIASCHERVACPKCKAPVGARCRSMLSGVVTKHSHQERWTLVQAAR